jgi:hypothetical protein
MFLVNIIEFPATSSDSFDYVPKQGREAAWDVRCP